MKRLLIVNTVLIAMSLPLAAQWFNSKDARAPRTKDGKVDLKAPALRKSDGKVDLSGVWQPANLRYLTSLDADGVQVPMKPWALAAFFDNQANEGKNDPDANCTFPGVPRIESVPGPIKVVQDPGVTLVLYESFTVFRQIFTDGRALPKDPNPSWMGLAVGKWDGDTFVVENAGFNDQTWLDNSGHPHTEALKVTERFRRINYGQTEIEITIDDPGAYLRPWTVKEQWRLVPDGELIEFLCTENNKDISHLVGK